MLFTDLMNKVSGFLRLPECRINPVISVCYGCGTQVRPDWKKLMVSVGQENTRSLYYNGVVYFRFMLPFYVGVMVRWSGSETKKAFVQTHIGWKLNGRPAITFRIQSDESGFLSNAGPEFNNHGQARGWACGTK